MLLLTTALRADEPKLPPFKQVIDEVRSTIGTFENYQPGDLFHRKQAEQLFDSLQRIGWTVSTKDRLLQRVPSPNDLICRVLLTDAGRSFMRKTVSFPGGLDRIDNLLRLPDGQKIVKQMIQGKDGDKLIEYLTTSRGGSNLGQMLGKQSNTNFNQPTGKLYTVKALMVELEMQYHQDVRALARAAGQK